MEDYKIRIKKLYDEISNMSSSLDDYPSLHPSRKLFLCRLITAYFPEVDGLYPLDWFRGLPKNSDLLSKALIDLWDNPEDKR